MLKLIKAMGSEYRHIMSEIIYSVDKSQVEKHELQLISATNLLMFFLISVASVPLGLIWELPIGRIGFFAVGILVIAGLIYGVSRMEKWPTSLQIHLVGLLFVLALVMTFEIYYVRLKVLFWFTMVIVSIFFNISSRSILPFYVILTSVIIFTLSVIQNPSDVLIIDYSFYFSLFMMLFFVIGTSLIVNRLYKVITENKIQEYRQLIEKNDEITSLYEEITATEEELREQNEKLHRYNDEINANKEKLEYLAYHDPLTGLPNREMIIEQLNILVDSDMEGHSRFSVVFIDLDNFKKINDSMGHSAGDELLTKVAQRFKAEIHPKDVIGRLGGDEMALIIRRNMPAEDLFTYVEEVCKIFNEPYRVQSINLNVSASFGIAMYPVDASSVEELLKAADTAMYKAKEIGKNNVQFYDKAMKDAILSRIEMENKIQSALINEEFYLEYQPLYKTDGQALMGFEALIRWQTKEQCRVSPGDFIPFAEESGLIVDIGEWVIKQACEQINTLIEAGAKDLLVAVNISAVQLKQVDFVDTVKGILKETNVKPENIEFEITESVFIDDKDKVIADIKSLQEMGITIAMDDFGTGYASLSYLMELPIDILKIDQSFVSAIEAGNEKNEVIRAIIKMAHALDIRVVAEGVETDLQLHYLEEESCDLLQGYLLNRPLSKSMMKALVMTNLSSQ